MKPVVISKWWHGKQVTQDLRVPLHLIHYALHNLVSVVPLPHQSTLNAQGVSQQSVFSVEAKDP